MQKKSADKPVWKKPAPKTASHTKLTETQKKEAKSRAKKAGRDYPNLVDNIAMARKSKKAT